MTPVSLICPQSPSPDIDTIVAMMTTLAAMMERQTTSTMRAGTRASAPSSSPGVSSRITHRSSPDVIAAGRRASSPRGATETGSSGGGRPGPAQAEHRSGPASCVALDAKSSCSCELGAELPPWNWEWEREARTVVCGGVGCYGWDVGGYVSVAGC